MSDDGPSAGGPVVRPLFRQFFTVLPLDDQLVATLALLTGLQAAAVLSIPAARLTTGGLTFTTTHRVIHRVHRNTTVTATDTTPTVTTGLTHALQRMIAVRNHTHRSITVDQHFPQFAGRHLQHGIFFFLVGQLSRSAGATHQLPALTRLHLNIVNVGTQRHVLHLKRIP